MLKLNRFSDDYMVNPLELLMNAFAYLQRYSPARGRSSYSAGSRTGTKRDQREEEERFVVLLDTFDDYF